MIRFSLVFNVDYTFLGLAQVIWVIGVSMILMAALIYLPLRVVGIAGIAMILLHNLLDGYGISPLIAFAGQPPPSLAQSLWLVLHQPGLLRPFGDSTLFAAYPLIPWVGVMATGYFLGSVYTWETERRRKFLFGLGSLAIVLFVVIRLVNVYGDPSTWRYQETGVRTLLSFLNTTKYPPSLLFLLMTLGPGLVILSLTDGIDGKAVWQRICIVFGSVPMFYYILHLFYAHGAAVLLTMLAGKDGSYLYLDLLQMGQAAPPNHGFPLWTVYAVWLTGLVLLYPLCLWWGNLKKRNKHWALSYL